MEERLAQDVAAVSYVGLWWHKWALNGWPTESLITFLSGGADTVSERNRISLLVSSILSLDSLDRPSAIPGDGTVSGSPKESSSRNRRRSGRKSLPRVWRSSLSAIYQRRCQRIDALAFSDASRCAFFIVMVIATLTSSKALLTWLLTMMNMMVIIFQEGQLFSDMHGQYERFILTFCLDFHAQVNPSRP